MNPAEVAARVRAGVGWFRRHDRGVIEITGADRVRWLNGMISNDVAALEIGLNRSGCYALLLTPKGRIVADLQVFLQPDCLWIELAQAAVADVMERLAARIIADDVVLRDASEEWTCVAIEGAHTNALLAAAGASLADLGPNAIAQATLGNREAYIARVHVCEEGGARVFVPHAAEQAVCAALRAASDVALADGDTETFEALRIHAGIPRYGAEIGEEVFPEEAGLIGRAVSLTKGCYTGQEIVARIESRGRVRRRLVSLAFATAEPPAVGAALFVDGKQVGAVTSGCRGDPDARGLAFVKIPHDDVGTELALADDANALVLHRTESLE